MKTKYFLFVLGLLIGQMGIGQNKEYLILDSDTTRLIIEKQPGDNGFFHQSPLGLVNSKVDLVNYWQIENDSLFEVHQISESESILTFRKDMNRIFYCPNGKLIHDLSMTKIYQQEKGFVIQDGILIETRNFDNSQTFISRYSNHDSVFYDFIRSVIDLTKIDKEYCDRVFIQIVKLSSDLKILETDILPNCGCDDKTNKEINRIIKMIPNWSIVYLHGEKTDYYSVIPINIKKL